MLRLKTLPAFAVVLTLVLLSCGEKKHENHQDHNAATTEAATEDWTEMDEFHMVMAETYHPFKDSANLQPAKEKAGALVTAAATWLKAPLPEKVDNEKVKSKLEQLKNDAVAFEQTVQAGDDEAIKRSLEDMHNLFHEIQEVWYGGGEDHDHH